MISTATRVFCLTLSAVSTAGLVAFSAPSVSIAAPAAPHAVLLANAPVAVAARG